MTFALLLTGSFTEAFYTGVQSTTAEVPGKWPVALAGRGYLLDLESGGYQHRSVPILKQQLATDQDEVGEGSVNPEGAWRRATDSWHMGAGQTRRDDAQSISQRYRTSKGIDPWTRGQIGLLHDTAQAHTTAATTVPMASTDQYVYWVSAAQAVERTDLTTSIACTGEPAANITSLVSDGKRIYGAFGASGTYKTNADNGNVFAVFEASAATLVGWAKGRVLSASGSALRDISTGTAVVITPASMPAAFVWTAIAEGTSQVYAAGNSGDKGLIYRIAVKSDGTGLDVPIVAGRLPDGETVAAIYGYAGLLLIGTSRGIRAASQGSTGDLTIGPLIDLNVTVRVFVGRGQFVWFGWTNYDATSTGTGRLDLANFTEPLVPAYATDAMVTGQGTVDGLAYLSDSLVIGVASLGVYKPSANLVASGTVESGVIGFTIVEDKLFVGGQKGVVGSGACALSISVEGSSYTTFDESGETERGANCELRLTLTRSASDSTAGPTVESLTLFAYPAVSRTLLYEVPLLLTAHPVDLSGAEGFMDIDGALDEIVSLVRGGQITTLQQGNRSATVRVEDYVFVQATWDSDQHTYEGTCTIRAKDIGG